MALVTLPYPSMDFTPLDILTADELDQIVANYEAINNATIQTANIANGAITGDKLSKTKIPVMGVGTTIITSLGTISSTTTYTATRDCYVVGKANARNGSAYIILDGANVAGVPYSDTAFIQVAFALPLVKGQTITFSCGVNVDCKFEGVEIRTTTYMQNY